jgi:hypothetical protein
VAILFIVSCNKNKENTVQDSINQIKTKVGLTGDAPVMDFEESNHNFGEIKEGEVVTHNFGFTNTGETPLIITNAIGSCGCTIPEYPKKPIAPGEKGVIKIQFNSKGFGGEKNKTVTIEANTINKVETIGFKANVIKKK